MREPRKGPQSKYKGHCMIAFYDKTGEHYLYSFDNVREILKFREMPITRTNVNMMNVELYRALKREGHITDMLTGKTMSVWIIDEDDDEDDD